MIELSINGTAYPLPDTARGRLLLWLLRDDLGLTGTKYGCGAGICGACTVHVDGVATRSCITPVSTLPADAQITTIEGLAATVGGDNDTTLHPVQQAFLDYQVPQCGWCMPGQIMTAAAYLDTQSADPSQDDINIAMGENYCRCGCYVRIREAVTAAAPAVRAAKTVRALRMGGLFA